MGLPARSSRTRSRTFPPQSPLGPDRLLVSNHRDSGVIPSSGGTPQPIDRSYAWAQMLPGGRNFLYTIDDPQLGSLRARMRHGRHQRSRCRGRPGRFPRSVHGFAPFRWRVSGLLACRNAACAAVRSRWDDRVTSEPRAIARRVSSFNFHGSADFSVSQRGMSGLPVLCHPLAVHLGGPDGQKAFRCQPR